MQLLWDLRVQWEWQPSNEQKPCKWHWVVSPDKESAGDELESERGEGRRRLMMMVMIWERVRERLWLLGWHVRDDHLSCSFFFFFKNSKLFLKKIKIKKIKSFFQIQK